MAKQVSMTVYDHDIVCGEYDSDSSSPYIDPFEFFIRKQLTRLEEETTDYNRIKNRFLMGMRWFKESTTVVAIHRIPLSNVTAKVRSERYMFMKKKCGGNPNVSLSWYGAPRDEIFEIISHGFSQCRRPKNEDELYGLGVYLSPPAFSIDGALFSAADENGIRHVLLCTVILGKSEEISAGSEQFQPSCNEFDSGVDNLSAPRRYIIWSNYSKFHIFPSYVVSFKAPPSFDLQRPYSPFMKLHEIMQNLTKYLLPSQMSLIEKSYMDFQKNKFTLYHLLQIITEISGRDVFIKAVEELNHHGQQV